MGLFVILTLLILGFIFTFTLLGQFCMCGEFHPTRIGMSILIITLILIGIIIHYYYPNLYLFIAWGNN